jgi:hypothetical protein
MVSTKSDAKGMGHLWTILKSYLRLELSMLATF